MQRSFLAACVLALLACAGTDQERTASEEPLQAAEPASAVPAEDTAQGTAMKPAFAVEARAEEPQAIEPAPPIELPWPVFLRLSVYDDSLRTLAYAIGWPGAEQGISEPPTLPASVALLHEGECRAPALEIAPVAGTVLPEEVEPRLPLYRLESAQEIIRNTFAVRQSLAFPADVCPATGTERIYIFGESSLWPAVEEEAKAAALEHLGWSAEEYIVEWHRGGGSWRLADGSHQLWAVLKVSAGPTKPFDYVVVGAYKTAEGGFAVKFAHSTGPQDWWAAIEPVDLDGDGELEMVFWTSAPGPPLDERYGLAILKRDATGEYQVWRRVTVEDVEARG